MNSKSFAPGTELVAGKINNLISEKSTP